MGHSSLLFYGNMNTTSNFVSPQIDIQRASVNLIENLIDKPTPTSAGAANQIASPNEKSGKGTNPVLEILKSVCNYEAGDRVLSMEIETIADLIKTGDLLKAVTNKLPLE